MIKKLWPWAAALAAACAAFVFFQWFYPYHLFRREQTTLFLLDGAFVGEYLGLPAASIFSASGWKSILSACGWAGALAGDFLTQLFYYKVAGPAIVAVALGLLWIAAWQAFRCICRGRGAVVPAVGATAVTAWELMRECGDAYALGSTLSLIGAFALLCAVAAFRGKGAQTAAAAVAMALCIWMFGYAAYVLAALLLAYAAMRRLWAAAAVAAVGAGAAVAVEVPQAEWWNSPNMAQELKLAVDSEMYFGNWDKALKLALKNGNTRYASFYYYLIHALRGELPQAVMARIPKDAESLLPAMDPTKNSIDLSALGEAWYYMGDMTAAEHCTIVAMMSSSRHTGTRYLRRLAEINLAKGDDEAAMKYLRLLQKTLCHSRWAQSRMPGRESEIARAKREDVGRYIAPTDTVRYVNDYTRSLRHLVNAHPDNAMAYDFLLCHDLLRCDLKAFADDLDPARPMPRLYQEAALIHLFITDASEEELDRYGIPEGAIEEFYNFNQLMPVTDANRDAMARRFGNTYWYFYQIAQQNENK